MRCVCGVTAAAHEESGGVAAWTVAEHTHHAENSTGSQCVACHMPKIAQTIKDGYVSEPYVPVYFAGADAAVGDSESLHVVP